ncbi:MAG: cytochrome P450 [Sphingomonadales bacterium]|nr:cytochrome P450 [Sphingomonadales bacterium]
MMEAAASDVLTADDPLYEELYDVRREAEAMGNFIERDVTAEIAALRAQAPVHKGKLRELLGLPGHERHANGAGRQHYTVLTYDACEAAFRNPAVFSNTIQMDPKAGPGTGLLEIDPPRHRAYRRAIQPKFQMNEALGWWRKRTIDGIVERLIERLARRPGAELNLDFCARIPVYTITTAIGLHGDEALRFRHAYLNSTSSSRNIPTEQRIENFRLVESLLHGLVAARREQPGDDLISFLLDATLSLPGAPPRPLTDAEIVTHAKLVMVAGGGTSWRQMGITLFALLTHPDQFAEVKADRGLMDAAIEEGLRWDPTAPYHYRLVLEDVDFYGHHIKAGSALELGLGPANRDPARWAHPDAYDIHRPPLTNMAFGLGTHRCLGMNVARVEIGVGINALIDAFPKLRLDPAAPAPFLTGGLEQRGPSGLPVLLD